jgi:spore maturation protein CgeB
MTLDIVIFGLSITSSWGNGHAATYGALAKALHRRGHEVTFIERDVPWYRDNRDLRVADYCRIELYEELREVPRRFGELVGDADLVIIGSYVPDGATLADWITRRARGVTAFYDIDTPVTLAGLDSGTTPYISAALIPRFDLYLSFTGGPLLTVVEDVYGSPRARVLYCAADIEPPLEIDRAPQWALGYLGTYSADRQPGLEAFLIEPARALRDERFVVAGSQYPANLEWPANVSRIEHLPQERHPQFYGAQRYALNITRADMRAAGFSPSVRLFEAAACGTPIVSDIWPGIESLFKPGKEILLVDNMHQVVQLLSELPDERRRDIAAAARRRLMREHTPHHRACQLEGYYQEVMAERRTGARLEIVA